MSDDETPREADTRWPRSVYGTGHEPDYRFSLANERTFLAWIRTALALLAAGVAIDALPTGYPEPVTRGAALLLSLTAIAAALLSWRRWAGTERAIRRDEPIGGLRIGLLATVAVGVVAIGGALLAVLS